MDIRLKRAYEPAAPRDGYRVLIDRLRPWAVTRERAALDERERELAPSRELRAWFGHEPGRIAEFAAGKNLRSTDAGEVNFVPFAAAQ